MSYSPIRFFILKNTDGQLKTDDEGVIVRFDNPVSAERAAQEAGDGWTVKTQTY